MTLVDDLEQAMCEHIRAAMPESAELPTLELRSLVHEYVAWRRRFPAAVPREVHRSREFEARAATADDEIAAGVAAALSEIAAGADLQPRLGKGVEHSPYGRDALLSDWGIHHLHLGVDPDPKNPRFVKRMDPLLFVAFRGTNAYVIDLVRHEDSGDNWAALRILEIVVRNWPDAGIVYRSNVATGIVGGNVSDEDRRERRRARVNGPVEIDGHVYSSLGQTLDGAPMQASHHAMKVQAITNALRWDDDEPDVTLRERAQKWDVPADGWQPVVHEEEFGFVSGGVFVPYGRLLP